MGLIIKQQGMIELTRHQKHQTAIKAQRTGGRWTPVYESNCAILSPEVEEGWCEVRYCFLCCCCFCSCCSFSLRAWGAFWRRSSFSFLLKTKLPIRKWQHSFICVPKISNSKKMSTCMSCTDKIVANFGPLIFENAWRAVTDLTSTNKQDGSPSWHRFNMLSEGFLWRLWMWIFPSTASQTSNVKESRWSWFLASLHGALSCLQTMGSWVTLKGHTCRLKGSAWSCWTARIGSHCRSWWKSHRFVLRLLSSAPLYPLLHANLLCVHSCVYLCRKQHNFQ